MTTNSGAPAAAALQSLEADRQTAAVVHALGDAGVPSLLLKGPAVARWLYPPGATRPVCDVDLLVPNSHWDMATGVMERLGLRRAGLDPDHATTWGAEGKLTVDLHRRVQYAEVEPERCWSVLSAQAETIALAGASVRIPSRPAQAGLLALHAAAHGRGWRPLSELELAIEREQLDVWTRARGIAIELGAVEAFAAGLRAARGGGALAQRLELPRPSRIDIELALEATPSAHGLARLGEATGALDLTRRVLNELAPPAEQMRGRGYPLADRGRLGLVASYALRPLIVALRMPSAFGAWRRARVRLGVASGGTRGLPAWWRIRVAAEVLVASVRLRRRLERAGIAPAIELARAGAPLAVEDLGAVTDARRLGSATQRVLTRSPGGTSCLIESLVLLRLLARRGVGARLVLALDPRDEPRAHAWLEVAGEPVLPTAGEGFARLAAL